jgi:hypothetical protein
MDEIYNRIEGLKNEFIRYMEEIISDKKRLLGLCKTIISILDDFDGLFSGIGDTVKKFEALNMITRIELGRQAELSRSLGGALASVKSLPVKMKQIMKESRGLYHRTQKNLGEAVAQYEENFKLQEEDLADCIGSIKRVSDKLHESQNHYRDISREIGRCCRKVLEFIDGDEQMSGLLEARESIRDIMASVNAYRELEYGNYLLDVAAMRRRILEAARHVPAGSVLSALSSDFGGEKTKESVIIF